MECYFATRGQIAADWLPKPLEGVAHAERSLREKRLRPSRVSHPEKTLKIFTLHFYQMPSTLNNGPTILALQSAVALEAGTGDFSDFFVIINDENRDGPTLHTRERIRK